MRRIILILIFSFITMVTFSEMIKVNGIKILPPFNNAVAQDYIINTDNITFIEDITHMFDLPSSMEGQHVVIIYMGGNSIMAVFKNIKELNHIMNVVENN